MRKGCDDHIERDLPITELAAADIAASDDAGVAMRDLHALRSGANVLTALLARGPNLGIAFGCDLLPLAHPSTSCVIVSVDGVGET